jgi:DNA-binding transcriptional MerR regulator
VSFTAAQAARLSDCTVAQLRYWSRSGLVVASGDGPDDDREPGTRAGYGFRDLVALRIVRSMLDAGLPSARVRVALDAVRDAGHDLTSLRLITDGRHVWACHDDGEILDALRAGQLALFVAVDQVAADVDADVRAFRDERAEFVDRLTAGG